MKKSYSLVGLVRQCGGSRQWLEDRLIHATCDEIDVVCRRYDGKESPSLEEEAVEFVREYQQVMDGALGPTVLAEGQDVYVRDEQQDVGELLDDLLSGDILELTITCEATGREQTISLDVGREEIIQDDDLRIHVRWKHGRRNAGDCASRSSGHTPGEGRGGELATSATKIGGTHSS